MTKSDDISCWIYKSSKKEEMYLYLVEEDGFDSVPDPLKQSFGEPIFVMELALSAERKLARANVNTVITSLSEQGFYLQLPPKLNPDLQFGD